jgi:tungstate transport system permease protein
LFVASLLSRSGPLGSLFYYSTPTAIVIGQTILAIPVITGVVLSGTSLLDVRLYETLLTLDKSRPRAFISLLYEVRFLVLTGYLNRFWQGGWRGWCIYDAWRQNSLVYKN